VGPVGKIEGRLVKVGGCGILRWLKCFRLLVERKIQGKFENLVILSHFHSRC
jgi:hypothetical protein